MDTIASTSGNWKNDPLGRISNISLAPSHKNSLVPLFEAIMNSIQAIEERFGRDSLSNGWIRITIVRDQDANCVGFKIEDNGIGFIQENLDSFVRMDSRKKVSIGGKGVGRLLWLKVTDAVKVESCFYDGSKISRVSFEFCLDDPIRGIKYSNGTSADKLGTTVHLHPYRDE